MTTPQRPPQRSSAQPAETVGVQPPRPTQFQLMAEYMKDYAVILMDARGVITGWNTGAREMFQYSPGEAVGLPIATIFTPEDRTQQAAKVELDKAAREGRAPDERWHLRKDGSRIYVSGNVYPVLESGHVVGFVKFMRDETKKKLAETDLRKAKEVAEQAKDRFLARLSHELRTPLMPVLMTASAMQRDARLPSEVRASVEVIRRNVELEARLIDDLLDLTKISRGKLELSISDVDVHTLVIETAAIWRDDVDEKQQTLTLHLDAPLHHVRGDAIRLQQVWWNLLRNAIKFTPRGGSITVRTFNRGCDLVVEVADTGIGIEAGRLSTIFRAFEQADASIPRLYGGLGLGLSISKTLVEMHKGRIAATSGGKDQGATLSVTLPAEPPAPTREELASVERAGAQMAHAPLRILVVEDHVSTSRVLVKLLEEFGHRATAVGTVAEALRVAGENKFDLLISDVGLPDGSGYDVMRELGEKWGLPGVAMTGYGMEEDVRRSREAGFGQHLTKPINVEQLDAVLHRAKRQPTTTAN